MPGEEAHVSMRLGGRGVQVHFTEVAEAAAPPAVQRSESSEEPVALCRRERLRVLANSNGDWLASEHAEVPVPRAWIVVSPSATLGRPNSPATKNRTGAPLTGRSNWSVGVPRCVRVVANLTRPPVPTPLNVTLTGPVPVGLSNRARASTGVQVRKLRPSESTPGRISSTVKDAPEIEPVEPADGGWPVAPARYGSDRRSNESRHQARLPFVARHDAIPCGGSRQRRDVAPCKAGAPTRLVGGRPRSPMNRRLRRPCQTDVRSRRESADLGEDASEACARLRRPALDLRSQRVVPVVDDSADLCRV